VKVREERDGDVLVLEPEGRVDSTTAPVLGERLTAAVGAPGARVVLDFRSVEYISSAGFRVLLLAAKRAETGASRLVLCGISGKVRQLFDIAGFLDLLPLYGARDESVASLR
jgi:anti-anti-sigma factor